MSAIRPAKQLALQIADTAGCTAGAVAYVRIGAAEPEVPISQFAIEKTEHEIER